MAAYPKFFTVKRIDLGILVKAPVLVAAGTELGGVVNALPVLYRLGIFPTGGGGVANAPVLQVVLQLQPLQCTAGCGAGNGLHNDSPLYLFISII